MPPLQRQRPMTASRNSRRRSGARSAAMAVFAALALAQAGGVDADEALPREAADGAPAAVVRLRPALVSSVAPGSVFRVRVWVDNPVELGAFQFTLGYDPTILEYVSVDLGPLLGSTGRETIELPVQEGPGSMTYGAASLPGRPGPSVSGVLATVALRGLAEGRSTLALDPVKLSDTENSPIPATAQGGRVTVRGDIFLPAAHSP